MGNNWKQVFELYDSWKYTKRVGTIQQDEDLFFETLNAEFVLIPRTDVKEVKFEDDYTVYLVNEEESNEERNYDA
tara:strand:- start:356 stop:580 length:225 start_codon:yes stop_codon:yes gene_type:complete